MAKKTSVKDTVKRGAKKTTSKVKKTVGNSTRKKRSSKKTKAKDNSAKLNANRGPSRKDKRVGKRDQKSRKKAEYLATLPKSRLKRLVYRLNPKRFFQFWFSKRGALMALKLVGVSMAILAAFIIIVFAYFRKDLPDPTSFSFDQSTRFYDRTGETLLWSVYGDENRVLLEYDQISDNAKWAHIAIEDKDFFEHGGFSISGISRAAVSQVFGDGSGGGGSTITQQFVKNNLVGNERTLTRKVKELILAIETERLYSKEEILTFYLNEIPYGVSEYGVESASRGFFDKTAKELTIDEAAMLAALPNAPSLYSPYGENTDLLIERQHHIINLMNEQGYITDEEADKAKETETLKKIVPLSKRNKYKNIIAPHFVLEIQKQLTEKYGDAIVTKGGLKVITTLDLKLQRIAEESVKHNVDKLAGIGADNTAFSASDPNTGQVLAMVGSRDFHYPKFGSFNVATSLRQPGSSFKPYSYAELFKSDRWGPGSTIFDTRTSFGPKYTPKNWDGRFKGTMNIRSALAESRNIPAIKSLYIAGVENVIDQAKRQGITSLGSPDQYGLSLVLGSAEVKLAEHVHGYATFANGGKNYTQTYVMSVTNSSGEVLEEWTEEEGDEALDPQIAYSITSILADANARARLFGAGSPYTNVPGLTMAVKTGTTDSERDGWMMAYTTSLVAGSWVGNNDNEPMYSSSYTMTGSVMMEFMRRAHEGQEDEAFPRPDGIKSVTLNSKTGRQADGGSGGTHTDIFPSWYKPIGKGDSKEVVIDTVSGKIATECTPERAKQKKTASGVLPEIPETDPMFSAWARSAPYGPTGGADGEKDDVHKCSDALPNVSISATHVGGGIYTLSATVSKGTHPLGTLNFKVGGQIVSSQEISSNGTYDYTHTFTTTGNHKVDAEVIDKVLYDNSNSTTVNVASIESGGPVITSPAEGEEVSAGPTEVTWDEVTGADHTLCWSEDGGGYICVADSGGNGKENISTNSGSSYTVYVVATIGGNDSESARISFTAD